MDSKLTIIGVHLLYAMVFLKAYTLLSHRKSNLKRLTFLRAGFI